MSRILTIGVSPYLLTQNGRIHQSVISAAISQGHYVESAVWNHDVSYFLPSEIGEHFFIRNGKRACRLNPYLGEKGDLAAFCYETMKRVQPQLVITIGTTADSLDVHAVKSMYPHLFKWVAILTDGTSVVNENTRPQLAHPELILVTNKTALNAIRQATPIKSEYRPFGPDHDQFSPNGQRKEFGVICCSKNEQTSNLPVFIQAVRDAGADAYLHTNIDDAGAYDLRLLVRRWGCDHLSLPNNKFVSVREGTTSTFLNEVYNQSHAVIDVSMQSGTALTLLEGMATGCVPIGVGFGAIGEVLQEMPQEFRFVVSHTSFIGPREEEYAMACHRSLADCISRVKRFTGNDQWFKDASRASIEVAHNFRKDTFETSLKGDMDRVSAYEHAIVVDSF
jgi:hypothetical protein